MPASEPIGEERRVVLINRLSEVLGKEEARTLMESLPPVYWHDLATKDDVRAGEDRLRTEMNSKFSKVHAEFAKVHAEFAKVYAEFANIRTEMTAEFKTLRAENKEFQGEIALQLAKQMRTTVFTLIGLAVPILGTILAVGLA